MVSTIQPCSRALTPYGTMTLREPRRFIWQFARIARFSPYSPLIRRPRRRVRQWVGVLRPLLALGARTGRGRGRRRAGRGGPGRLLPPAAPHRHAGQGPHGVGAIVGARMRRAGATPGCVSRGDAAPDASTGLVADPKGVPDPRHGTARLLGEGGGRFSFRPGDQGEDQAFQTPWSGPGAIRRPARSRARSCRRRYGCRTRSSPSRASGRRGDPRPA